MPVQSHRGEGAAVAAVRGWREPPRPSQEPARLVFRPAGAGRFFGEFPGVSVPLDHPAEHADQPDREREEDQQDGDQSHVRTLRPGQERPPPS